MSKLDVHPDAMARREMLRRMHETDASPASTSPASKPHRSEPSDAGQTRRPFAPAGVRAAVAVS